MIIIIYYDYMIVIIMIIIIEEQKHFLPFLGPEFHFYFLCLEVCAHSRHLFAPAPEQFPSALPPNENIDIVVVAWKYNLPSVGFKSSIQKKKMIKKMNHSERRRKRQTIIYQ